ncbi:MAG: hypothetical protein UY07_C0026G0001 [Parcubacteria group bacterium GW2011_GWA1_47_8]|nr:MAG: hypothetical protein UY07_C0026G0001 [Parcubacteria group bacterium GW2011_GWA1_47_8]
MKSQKKFDKTQSVLKDVYLYFGAKDPGELKTVYMNADQELMRSAQWDYKDNNLLTNQIKEMVEKVGVCNIRDTKEKKWIQSILWMWYHHAISCALWKYGDKKTAQKYSKIALALQPIDHPNKITRLLYFLVRDDIKSAEQWAKTIHGEPEKTTARYSIKLYKQGDFFKPQIA